MMAILNRTQELPRDRAKLYERASEVLLHQWDFETKEGLTDPELKRYLYNIDLRDKKEILRLVANAMQAGEKGLAANLIYREDLERILAQYLESTGIGKRDANDLTDLIIKQLRHRNFILCSLGGNTFAFVHRTFLEYFCACQFYERFKKRGLEGGITLEELKTEVFGQHWSDSSWREVLRLIIGMLSAEFPKDIADELINYLIDLDGKEKEFSNIFLAVDCFSELRNRSAHGEVSQRLLDYLQSLTKLDREFVINKNLQEKAVSTIGTIWQDDPIAWRVLQFIAQSRNVWFVKEEAVNQLSIIAKIHGEALSFLQQLAQKGESRARAISALAKHWRDEPETFPIIQQLAQKGEWSAIDALAKHWRDDPQTFPFIQQQAQKGEWSAIYVLAEHWPDEPETFPIIQQQAQKGEWSAIYVLAEHWPDEPETFPIIQQQAQKGEWSAISALAEHWHDEPETLPIIQQLAQKAEGSAIYVLARYYPELELT
ncbi:NACHT domain-containing protein [Gloeothece citriformis]|uniref:NACHT domain-containing protein n=1 Tax=Gloeothece citriformis TaxID=2546356 RepID=UPI0002D98D35|nr:hypothetical protein [Gloeothece citriformis]